MSMKSHLLAAVQEQIIVFDDWLAGLTIEQLRTPLSPSHWTVKDNLAHLMAWQIRSNARFEAALGGLDPVYPKWTEENLQPDSLGNINLINDAIYKLYKDTPYSQVYEDWRSGYGQLCKQAAQVEEIDLLDGGKFPWLNGFALADVLLGTYDHHLEHLNDLQKWMAEHK
jgi:hypothetical protein